MRDLCGCSATGDHSHWDMLLREWMLAIHKYHHVTEDVPYWYNERANVGLLAAAAWRCGYVALEEYADSKRRAKGDAQSGNDGERDFIGRPDLWIGRHGDSQGEIIEAKLHWMSGLDNASKIKSDLEKGLKKSFNAARASKTGKGRTIGLTFFVPEVSAETADIEAQLNTLIEITGKLKYPICAWYFPDSLRQKSIRDPNLYYPGVLLIAQPVLRGN